MRLGREIRLKQAAAVGDRDTAAVVFDGEDKESVFCSCGHVNPTLVGRRVDRVQDEVKHDLSQVIAHSHDRRQIARDVGRDRPLLGAVIVLGDPERLFDDFAGPDPADLGRRRPREVDQLANGSLDPLQLPRGKVELLGRVGVGPAPLEDLNERAQGCQRIADLVSDPRGQAGRTPPSFPGESPSPETRAGLRSVPRPVVPGLRGPRPARC